jgi:hypothetical protein
MSFALAALTLLCAAPPPSVQPEPPAPREQPAPPLSKEDEELVKQLALLEQLDLVKNLDLFDPKPDAPPEDQPRQR